MRTFSGALFSGSWIGQALLFGVIFTAPIWMSGCGAEKSAPKDSRAGAPESTQNQEVPSKSDADRSPEISDSNEKEAAESESRSASNPAGDSQDAGYGSIAGVVRFEGTVPQEEPTVITEFAECEHHGSMEIASEAYMVQGDRVANVLVYVFRGLPKNFETPVPQEPVKIDQIGCRYVPHFVAARVGQPVRFTNSDPGTHNIRSLAIKRNAEINFLFNEGGEQVISFTRPEIVKLVCDVHPWMRGYIGVFDHPFYSVTNADGQFRLDGVPAGDYKVRAYHEKWGTLNGEVAVTAGGAAELDFKF